MQVKVWSTILLANWIWIAVDSKSLSSVAPAASSGMRIVCYYSSWAMYRPGHGMFDIEDFPVHLCTHAVYAFLGLNNRTWELLVLDPENDVIKGGYRRFTALKKKNPTLKTLVSIGGWMEGGRKYSEMASKPERRRTFVNSVVDFLKRFNFDGLDLDWEFPASPDREGLREDRDNFVLLLKELKSAFHKEDWGWMLTAVVPIMKFRIDSGYKVEEITSILDFINLLSYDLRGNWTGFTDGHTPLRRREFDTGDYAEVNIHDGANLWVQRGAPKDKLSISFALYGRTYTLDNPSHNGLHAPLNQLKTAGDMGSYTRSNGTLAYYEICEAFKNGKWDVRYDQVGQSSYAVKGDQWIGYDDKRSLAEKTKYAKEEGYGGVAIWSVDLDDFRGLCGERFALMKVIFKQVTGRAASRLEEPVHSQTVPRLPTHLPQSPLSAVHQIPQELSTFSKPSQNLWEIENSRTITGSLSSTTETVSSDDLFTKQPTQEIESSEISDQVWSTKEAQSSSSLTEKFPDFLLFEESGNSETSQAEDSFRTFSPANTWVTENPQLHQTTESFQGTEDGFHETSPNPAHTDSQVFQADVSHSTETTDFISQPDNVGETPAGWGSTQNQNTESEASQGFTQQQITPSSHSRNRSHSRFQRMKNQQQFTGTTDYQTPISFSDPQFSFNPESIPQPNTPSLAPSLQTDQISQGQFELQSQNTLHDPGSSVLPVGDFAQVQLGHTTPKLLISPPQQEGDIRQGRGDQFHPQPREFLAQAPQNTIIRPPHLGGFTPNFQRGSVPVNGHLKVPELQGGFVPSRNMPIFTQGSVNGSTLGAGQFMPTPRDVFRVRLPATDAQSTEEDIPATSPVTFPLPFAQIEIQSPYPISDISPLIDSTETSVFVEDFPTSFHQNGGLEGSDPGLQTTPLEQTEESLPIEDDQNRPPVNPTTEINNFGEGNLQASDLQQQNEGRDAHEIAEEGNPLDFITPPVILTTEESIDLFSSGLSSEINVEDLYNNTETVENVSPSDNFATSNQQPEYDITQHEVHNITSVDTDDSEATLTVPLENPELHLSDLVSDENTITVSPSTEAFNGVSINHLMPSTFKPGPEYYQLELGSITPQRNEGDNFSLVTTESITTVDTTTPFLESDTTINSSPKTRRRRLRKRLKRRRSTTSSPIIFTTEQSDFPLNHTEDTHVLLVTENLRLNALTTDLPLQKTQFSVTTESFEKTLSIRSTYSPPEETHFSVQADSSSSEKTHFTVPTDFSSSQATRIGEQTTLPSEAKQISQTTSFPTEIIATQRSNRRRRIRLRARNQKTTAFATTTEQHTESTVSYLETTSQKAIDSVDSHFESLAPKRRKKVPRLRPSSTENREVYAVSPPNDNDQRPIVSDTAPECSKGQLYTSHPVCDKYWWCIHGTPTLNTCGQGLLWNPQTSSCDWPANINRDDCE